MKLPLVCTKSCYFVKDPDQKNSNTKEVKKESPVFFFQLLCNAMAVAAIFTLHMACNTIKVSFTYMIEAKHFLYNANQVCVYMS